MRNALARLRGGAKRVYREALRRVLKMVDDKFDLGPGTCTVERDKAICVELDPDSPAVDGNVEVWLPKSVVHDDSEVWEYGQEGEVYVQRWFARKQGWCD